MTVTGKSRSLRDFFGRKKSTYGLILPEEFEEQERRHHDRMRRRNNNSNVKDLFCVPSEIDNWELPQYDSLFNHLMVTQDGSFRRRLSSTVVYNHHNDGDQEETHSTSGESSSGPGPLKAVQKWFREIVKSITHHSAEYDLGGDVPVDGIPVDMCEKMKYVHIYL